MLLTTLRTREAMKAPRPARTVTGRSRARGAPGPQPAGGAGAGW
jgi:hypothetical protein